MADQLLALQALDTTLDQLAHRLASLPARAAQEEVATQRDALTSTRTDQQVERDALARDERRLEDEASTVEDKVHTVERQMAASTSPKDLMAMQHEVETLRARQRELEDEAIELMERIEPLDAALVDLDARLGTLAERDGQLNAELGEQEAEIAEEMAAVRAQRDELAAAFDAALLTTYEQMRGQLGGVAVARFEAGRCTGCHLTLSAVEADHIRHAPADELVPCPECGRLLVR
jgi:predicted  nucleic acid-binding Zn-ribbon protein